MVGLLVNLREFLSPVGGGCARIAHVGTLDFAPVPFSFGYVAGNARLGPNFGEELDAAIVSFMRTPRYTELRARWLYDGFSCPGDGPGDEGEAPQVSFHQMRGLFLCCGLVGALALLIGIVELAWHYQHAASAKVAAADGDDEYATEAGMLRALLTKVDDLRVQNILSASANKVASAFGIIDRDGSGTVTHDELFNGLHKHGDLRKIVGLRDGATLRDFEQLVQDADRDGDQVISLDEFEKLCRRWKSAARDQTAARDQEHGAWEVATLGG